ncbi:translation initiation factor IF-2-like [Penaeus chinensis]|uniref:translation initiation factor IF-2-like n=1 Tax=Penaeus chinensis TaxID=139456 RepID=UPI001FB6F98D|nr:translation initiation factor IF-2-like [Penaeus chinensis]
MAVMIVMLREVMVVLRTLLVLVKIEVSILSYFGSSYHSLEDSFVTAPSAHVRAERPPPAPAQHRLVPRSTASPRAAPPQTAQHRLAPRSIASNRAAPPRPAQHRLALRRTASPRAAPPAPAQHRLAPRITASPRAAPPRPAQHRLAPRSTASPRAAPPRPARTASPRAAPPRPAAPTSVRARASEAVKPSRKLNSEIGNVKETQPRSAIIECIPICKSLPFSSSRGIVVSCYTRDKDPEAIPLEEKYTLYIELHISLWDIECVLTPARNS